MKYVHQPINLSILSVCTGGAPQRTKSIKTRVAQYTTPMESITAHATESDEEDQDDDELP